MMCRVKTYPSEVPAGVGSDHGKLSVNLKHEHDRALVSEFEAVPIVHCAETNLPESSLSP